MALTLTETRKDRPFFGFIRMRVGATSEQHPAGSAIDDETVSPVFRSIRSEPFGLTPQIGA